MNILLSSSRWKFWYITNFLGELILLKKLCIMVNWLNVTFKSWRSLQFSYCFFIAFLDKCKCFLAKLIVLIYKYLLKLKFIIFISKTCMVMLLLTHKLFELLTFAFKIIILFEYQVLTFSIPNSYSITNERVYWTIVDCKL